MGGFLHDIRVEQLFEDPILVAGNRGRLWYNVPDKAFKLVIEDQVTGALFIAVIEAKLSRGATILFPDPITVIVWRAPFACTATAVRGYRVGGNSANKINAVRGRGSPASFVDLLPNDKGLTQADEWNTVNNLQNADFIEGDQLLISIRDVSGAPDQVAVQVDFTRP